MSNFFLATVIDSIDPLNLGELQVRPMAGYGSGEIIPAKAALPFGGKGHGIMSAVTPSSVVVCAEVAVQTYDDDIMEVFWFGVAQGFTTVRNEDNTGNLLTQPKFKIGSTAPDSYGDDDTISKTIVRSPVGHTLELAEDVHTQPNAIKYQKDYALLSTQGNKKVLLDSGLGPGMDKIVITDESIPANHVVIQTGKCKGTVGPESILIECTGNMHINSRKGQLDIHVDSGSNSNINIINEGTGDITMQCHQGDTYISSQGLIKVDATDIEMNASNTLNLKAETSMTLKAPRIDMNPPEE